MTVDVIFVRCPKGETRDRLARLDELRGLLAARDYTTAAELATGLGVSVRTLHRNLALLREQGVPVDSDRGRGGGLSLAAGWSMGRVHLGESEALGLLLSQTIAERIGSPLLLDDLRSVGRKVATSFAPAHARRILAIRHRILVGSNASDMVLATVSRPSPAVARNLLTAFGQQRLATIDYRDGAGTRSQRPVEAQYLYYALPIWYLVAWDRMRDDIRSFRIDRIIGAEHGPGPRPAEAKVPPWLAWAEFVARLDRVRAQAADATSSVRLPEPGLTAGGHGVSRRSLGGV